MQNKTLKSLLVKFLTVLCALCCCLGLVCGLVGCGEEVRSIVKTEINDKGELVIHYNIGEPENLGVVVGANGAPGANGAQGGILGNCEQHDFVTYTAQQATCQVEEIKVNFCTKCKGYDVVVGQTNGDVHGTFKKEIITDSATGDKIIVDYFESAIVELPAKPGDVAGSCLEKQCELCEKFLATHQRTEKVAVDTGVSVCEEEHLEILICSDCKNPILDKDGKQQISKEPARGHAYAVDTSVAPVLDDKGTVSTKDDTYKVALICSVCGDDDFATATYNDEKSSPATCKVAGYDVFTYTYNAYDLAEAKIVEKTGEIKNEYPVQTTHTFKTGDIVVEGYADGDPISYTKDNAAALDALIEAKVIELTYAQDRKCEVWGKAVARCAVCDELINVTINAAHEYEAEVPADCINDAYIPCKNCDVKEVTTLAIGHVWEYKEGSIDTIGMTADLACKNCTAVKLDVPVTAGTVKQPTNCSERPITPYTTAEVDNGLPTIPEVHANYNDEIVVTFEIVDTTAEPEHAYVNAEGKVLFTVKAGDPVDHNSDIAACIGKMTENPNAIECTYGPDATCQSTAPAVFRCQTCGELININLYGPHTEVYDTNGDKFVHAATCTENGYYYTKCNVGGTEHEVVYDTIKATGHKFEIVDKDAFVTMVKADRAAAVENTTTIDIECECGDTATATLVKKEFAAGDPNSCAPFDTYTYTFEYAAAAEDDFAANTYTFVITDTDGYEAHKVAGLDDVRFYNGQENVNYETVAQFLGRIDAGKIEVTFGPDADCGYDAPAVFRCELCQELINISVNGPHALDGIDVVVAPTCTTEGYTYQTCTAVNCPDADRKIEMPNTRVDELEHKYTWAVEGAEAEYDADGILTGINYGTCTATCANTVGCVEPILTAEAELVDIAGVQDCCDKGSVTIRYFVDADADGVCDDAEVVATKTIVIEIADNPVHDYGTIEKIITIGEDTYKYCYAGNKYIKQ
ncbi:MAG: hypothetical protein E7342_00420 [Clostridiales bacterium]|nr:hypothetical protein [Clostridiales bacterium]